MFTVEADIHHGLHAASIADLPVFHVATHFHNHSSPFVARGLGPKFTHSRHWQVFKHVVQIRITNAGSIEP